MHAFWKWLLQGLLTAAQPRVIVEVGAGAGRNTKNLLEFAVPRGALVHVVDPAPGSNVEVLASAHGSSMVLHRERGVDALAKIAEPDVVLLDGDRNWYTVHRELQLLQEDPERSGRPFPLTCVTNVSWPYGRRDSYVAPEDIPEEHRHPHRRAAIVLGQPALSDEAGVNGEFVNAEDEGTPRNGVLTAVEDFVAGTNIPMELRLVHGYSGLGVLVPRSSLTERPELRAAVDRLTAPDFLHLHTKRLEQVNSVLLMGYARQKRELREANLASRASVTPPPSARPKVLDETLDATSGVGPVEHAAPESAPLALRVAFVGSDRLAELLASSCHLTAVAPDDWKSVLRAGAQDLLLVETTAPERPGAWSHETLTKGGELSDLLQWCRSEQVPSALWATVPRALVSPYVHVARRFDHHFVADPEAASLLGEMSLAKEPPGVLPHAVQPRLHRPAPTSPGAGSPLYVGGLGRSWPEPAQRMLRMALKAAQPHGLRIAVPAGEDADFPRVLQNAVVNVAGLEAEIALLQRAPVVLAFDPAFAARQYVPRSVFEALACGAGVVAAPNWGITHYLATTVAAARTPEEVAEQLGRLLGDVAAREELVATGRRYIDRAHTYDHRLATIASCVGLRLVPAPPVLQPDA